MTIELITGSPGAGKTLYALQVTKSRAEKENRQVFYSGIADLKLPWTEIDPQKWFECPANSIIVIDECQRIFRLRTIGAQVPDYVSQLETHRHKGIDLVFITQHPMLLDTNVRRLVGRHFHVARRFGMQRSSIFEYESCKDQPLQKIDTATARTEWTYPKEAFSYYKSAEVHTVKRRLPFKYFVIAGALVSVVLAVGFTLSRFKDRIQGTDASTVALKKELGESASIPGQHLKQKGDYFADRLPRITGLAFTAPVFDEVTKPVDAPYPAACVSSKSRCKCFSQQATILDVHEGLCRQIVERGYFRDWESKRETVASNQTRPERVASVDRKAQPEDKSQSTLVIAAPPPLGRVQGYGFDPLPIDQQPHLKAPQRVPGAS
jgi:zona occludens toxin